MATTKKPKKPGHLKYIKPVYLPGKHKGNIPAAAIRAAVRQVVEERRKREAEDTAAPAVSH